MENSRNEIVLYQPNDAVALEVMVNNETVWLSLNQMVWLFDRDKSVISRHIKNIFEEKELSEKATVANFATVQNENGRLVERQIDYYNLDVIILLHLKIWVKSCLLFQKWKLKERN